MKDSLREIHNQEVNYCMKKMTPPTLKTLNNIKGK
jgi:hypothetical protein